MFIDIHSHLESFTEMKEVIKNSKEKNVLIILTCGTNSQTNQMAIALSEMYSEIKACLGIYPTDALKMSKDDFALELKFMRKNKDKFIAIGEVGLDLKENSERTIEKQKDNLKKFVELAKDLNKPIIIHSRKAELQAIEILEEIGYNKILMHCFSGKKKLVQRIIDNGWYLSIPTNVKFSKQFQEIIEITPIEQLFCETDSPFLHPDKDYPNEPANVIESYKKIAEIKDMKLKEIEKKIEENYHKVFNA